MMPTNITLAPVIQTKLTPEYYTYNAVDMNEESRLLNYGLTADIQSEPTENYPHLQRFTSEFSAQIANRYGGITLNVPETFIENTSNLYISDDIDEAIKATEMPFYSAVKEFRSASLKNLNKTIENFNGNLLSFIHKFWKGEV